MQQQLSQQTQSTTMSTQPPPVALEAQVRGRQLSQNQVKQSQPSPVQKSHSSTKKLMITKWKGEWELNFKAPTWISRGDCVVDGDEAYFMDEEGENVCSFNSSNRMWSQLPQCPCVGSSLVVIRGLLTAIGGQSRGGFENKLLSILDNKWVEHFPPMPTKRRYTSAVTTKQHLIVAGGEVVGLSRLDTVEVMDIETLVWSTAASLPHPYYWASATICEDHLYMLGGYDMGGNCTKSVLTCSLTALLRSCGETSSGSVWRKIADTPVVESTCAAVGGELVAVGGKDIAAESKSRIADAPVVKSTCAAVGGELVAVGGQDKKKNTSAVYQYNMISKSWDVITNMPTARGLCLVAVLPTNEMMVVGGDAPYKVEIAKITYSA